MISWLVGCVIDWISELTELFTILIFLGFLGATDSAVPCTQILHLAKQLDNEFAIQKLKVLLKSSRTVYFLRVVLRVELSLQLVVVVV